MFTDLHLNTGTFRESTDSPDLIYSDQLGGAFTLQLKTKTIGQFLSARNVQSSSSELAITAQYNKTQRVPALNICTSPYPTEEEKTTLSDRHPREYTPRNTIPQQRLPEQASTDTTTYHHPTMSEPLFSPDLISPEVAAALPPTYTIRPIERTDYANGFLDVLRVLTQVGDVSEARWNERYDWMKRRSDEYFILCVLEGEKIVGTGAVVVERKFIHDLGLVGHIEDIAVAKDQQGKKLGLRIIQALDYVANKVGCYKVMLSPFFPRLSFPSLRDTKRDMCVEGPLHC